jgi:hypothetical protein
MLEDQDRLLGEMENLKTVSLNEAKRRAASDKREKRLKEEKKAFLESKGLKPPPEDKQDDDGDSAAEEADSKAIGAIELDEAARVLTDYITGPRAESPRAAME